MITGDGVEENLAIYLEPELLQHGCDMGIILVGSARIINIPQV